jgi:hypothetical protein
VPPYFKSRRQPDELGPDDVFDVPLGHDGYVIGHEPVEAA